MQIPSKKFLGRVLLLSLCLQLQACVFTLHTWKEVPDPPQVQQASEAEREQYYQKYAIHSLNNYLGVFPFRAFNTAENPEHFYDLYSSAAMVTQVYPEAEQKFQEALFYRQAQDWGWGLAVLLCLGSIVIAVIDAATQPRNSNGLADNSKFSPLIQVAGLMFVADIFLIPGIEAYFIFRENQQYYDIQQGYNAALRQQLNLQPDTFSGLIPEPTLAVK